jgi:hypothetical protein
MHSLAFLAARYLRKDPLNLTKRTTRLRSRFTLPGHWPYTRNAILPADGEQIDL